MEKIGNKRRLFRRWCAWACSFAVLSGSVCFAAIGDPSPGELLTKAGQEMKAKKYGDAIDTMYLYLDLVEPSTSPGVIKIAQDLRMKLIAILIETDRLDEAPPVLQDYIDKPLGEYPRLARNLLATCLYETGSFEDCVVAVTNALRYNEDPASRAGENPNPDGDKKDYTMFEVKNLELEYSHENIVALYMTMAESYFNIEKWEESITAFQYVAEHTTDAQGEGYAIMQMINAMVAMPDFERIAEWIPQLYRTPARFNIRVNLALMNVAASLYGEGNFDEALPLYRMILPREELLAYQEERLREMRKDAGLAAEEGMEVSAEEALLFGVADEREATEEEMEEDGDELIAKPKEITELENLIIQVKDLPPYENDIKYRMAQIYSEVDRYWEAVKFLDIVYMADPESDMGKFSFYQLIKILLQELDELADAERRAFEYLTEHREGVKPRQIAYQLTNYYQKNDKMESIRGLLPYIDGLVRTNETRILQYDVELYFMQAVADLVLFNFPECEQAFKRVLDEFPGSKQESNSLYWYGMSMLFQQKFAEAYEVFEDYAVRCPDGDWIDEASFQGGVCMFGIAGNSPDPDYAAASNRCNYVIATYPNLDPDASDGSSIFPQACNMRGDFYGANGELEKAEVDYRKAIEYANHRRTLSDEYAKKHDQATYAVFKLAAIFKAMDQYDAGILLVEEYLEEWKAEADIAKALFWIGKSKLQKGAFLKDKAAASALVDEVVDDYLAAIIEYGTDVLEYGVDMMIDELVNVTSLWLNEEKRTILLDELQVAIETTDSLALKLRLRVVVAMITKTESVLGRQLLAELSDFDQVSPPVLSIICKISIEMEDYSRAEELLEIFNTKFEDSEFIKKAYKLRVLGQYAAKEYEEALATVDGVQELYSDDYDMSWAQLMRAQLLLEQGLFDEATDANMMVLGVPAWRGVPVARATYQLGQVEERAGRFDTAFAYYQRVYFQYKGYADGYWAAEGYLASANCLQKLGLETDRRNTFIAMLYDSYVNTLPQADVARDVLGAAEVAEIEGKIQGGATTNITVVIETDMPETETNKTETVEGDAPEVDTVATGGEE